jgi:hypothetical protein
MKDRTRYIRFAVLPPIGAGEKPNVLREGETVAGSLLLDNATIVRIRTFDEPRHTGRVEAIAKVREAGLSPHIFKVLD